MKRFLLACLVACVAADVSHIPKDESRASISIQDLNVAPDGSYQWAFETDNGIKTRAEGEISNPDSENAEQVVQGQASWTSPEGEPIEFQYLADKNGYQPQGSHLPTPPPIPEAILRALKYIQEHPPAPTKE